MLDEIWTTVATLIKLEAVMESQISEFQAVGRERGTARQIFTMRKVITKLRIWRFSGSFVY